MRIGFRLFLMGALGVAACAAAARAADGERVTFDTLDGVTLEGTFYKSEPKEAKDKNATVLLLHNFGKGGGSSHQDNWDDLAKALSADGYSVLSFDFRGFGNSHKVSPDFWAPIKGRFNREYMPLLANKSQQPDTIDHKDFDGRSSEYYPYLVNDVAAAKSYLDKHSNSGQANSSNLIVIGAGEGATVGALWMESQWHLQKVGGIDPKTLRPTLDPPEGRDQACAVWLDLSPKLGGREVRSDVHRWMVDVSGANKVPMVFIYGKGNESAGLLAKAQLQSIENKVHQNNAGNPAKIKAALQFTDVKAIDGTKLGGSQLLGVGDTQTFIKKYVDQVMDDRGPRDPRPRDIKMDTFLWNFPGEFTPQDAKFRGEDSIHLVPQKLFMR